MSQPMTPRQSEPNRRYRILVADDHPLLREGVIQLINRQEDLVCCGEADSTASTKASVAAARPDLVLLDLRLGGGDGFELIRSLRAGFPDLRVLILSQYDEALYIQRALSAGANGYVTKEQATEEVLGAIRAVLAGETYLSSNISMRVLKKVFANGGSERSGGVDRLTNRELHVFHLIGAGKNSKEIATELGVSPSTVETHRENIKHKLGLRSSSELTQFAEAWRSHRDSPLPETPQDPGL